MTEALEEAAKAVGQKVSVRRHPGFDHSYFFISSFMEDHVKFHAKALAAKAATATVDVGAAVRTRPEGGKGRGVRVASSRDTRIYARFTRIPRKNGQSSDFKFVYRVLND